MNGELTTERVAAYSALRVSFCTDAVGHPAPAAEVAVFHEALAMFGASPALLAEFDAEFTRRLAGGAAQ